MSPLARLRKSKGLTTQQVAARLGVTAGSVSNWETGKFMPHPRLLKKLGRLLKTAPYELTKLIEPEAAPQPGATAA